jgi:hypothetical protein
VKRLLLLAVLVVLGGAAIYWFLVRDTTVVATVTVPKVAGTIGSGSDAVAVSADGEVLPWYPLSEENELPKLPLSEAPKNGHLTGHMLEQARVLGAVPPALRQYVAGSYYGESGVDVELSSGIELRFGDASQAALKWKAVAAVLANPQVSALDYVNVVAPENSSYGGSGHELPPVP